MKHIPDIISTKDLAYIKDMFGWNFNIAKKAYNYSLTIDDEDIKKTLEKTYKLHRDICEKLIKILKEA